MKNKIIYATFVIFVLGVSSNIIAVNITDTNTNESDFDPLVNLTIKNNMAVK